MRKRFTSARTLMALIAGLAGLAAWEWAAADCQYLGAGKCAAAQSCPKCNPCDGTKISPLQINDACLKADAEHSGNQICEPKPSGTTEEVCYQQWDCTLTSTFCPDGNAVCDVDANSIQTNKTFGNQVRNPC